MEAVDLSAALIAAADGVRLRVKVVPNASRSRVAGLLGDRLKVLVAAPPEAGKANRAVCELIAHALGVSVRDVAVVAGESQPRKTVEVLGIRLCDAVERLRTSAAGA